MLTVEQILNAIPKSARSTVGKALMPTLYNLAHAQLTELVETGTKDLEFGKPLSAVAYNYDTQAAAINAETSRERNMLADIIKNYKGCISESYHYDIALRYGFDNTLVNLTTMTDKELAAMLADITFYLDAYQARYTRDYLTKLVSIIEPRLVAQAA